ncbi:MAG: hypothetical protein R2828_01895 [Saprospiraceae bacterium]
MHKLSLLGVAALVMLMGTACLPQPQTDQEEILSLVFNTQIGNKDHFEAARPTFSSPSEMEAWENRMRRLNRKVVFFNQAKLNNFYKTKALEALKQVDVEKQFLDSLTNWDKSDIQNQSPYEIINYDEFEHGQLDSIHVGIMTFSAISLNNKADRGVLYFDWLCSRSCGYGNIVIVKKIEGKWIIEKILKAWSA